MSIESKITEFNKSVESLIQERQNLYSLREDFVNNFTEDKLESMEIEEYCLGKKKGIHNFSYGLQWELDGLGTINGRPGASALFGVWYSTSDNKYKISRTYSKQFDNHNDAFSQIKKDIVALYKAGREHNLDDIFDSQLDDWLKGKFLATYFPEDYLSIYSKESLQSYVDFFDLEPEYSDALYLREALMKYKNEHPVMKEWPVDIFAFFLWDVVNDEISEDVEEDDETAEPIWNSEERMKLYQEYIKKCTSSANSWQNYSQFSRIDTLIKSIHPEYNDLIEYDDPDFVKDIYDELMALDDLPTEPGQTFKRLGQGQYHNAVLTYINFLRSYELLSGYSTPIHKEVSATKTGNTLQKIYFGTPGGGKSFKIQNIILKGVPEEFVYRTTFHPDTDYASFVGSYKPTAKTACSKPMTVTELNQLYIEFKKTCKTYPEVRFAGRYYSQLEKLNKTDRLHVFAGSKNSMVEQEVPRIIVGTKEYADYWGLNDEITYSFIPQIFINIYVSAWNDLEHPYYLVIEEINRGNCAQIFGDLFQLLDRTNGISDYPIKADEDLKTYLSHVLKNKDGIKNGNLCLPPNLNILATMNTSDQSLFPMDSAFKRRWSWEFVPSSYNEDDNYNLTFGDKTYKWHDFLKAVNPRIKEATDSEDKQLGSYFIKSDMDAEEFKSKVMYYLWSEICKEEYKTRNNFFRHKAGDKLDVEFTFNELYTDGPEDASLLNEFMEYILRKD